MQPKQLVRRWVEAFNRADADALADMYADDAVNHQVAQSPVRGREAIREMFAREFAAADMTCIVENLFEDGEWAIIEWRDPLGLRGCGFFHVIGGRIVFQRGYWDKLSFLRAQRYGFRHKRERKQSMKLIGMLDSPYVRRVAVSLQLLGLRFEHEALSVFRTYEQFRQINPVVKAPTLVCDDGGILLDSTLILQYAEALARPRSLMPSSLPELQRDLKIIGLSLAACEKAVQIIYEHELRPAEKQHQPWLDRVSGQLRSALRALEEEVARRPLATTSETMTQAGVSAAVAWEFTRKTLAEMAAPQDYPALAAFSLAAEALPEFRAAPHCLGTVQAGA